MQKARDTLLLLAQLIVLPCFVVILAKQTTLQQDLYSTPIMSESRQVGFDEVKLAEIVEKQYGLLPTPKDGLPGAPGANGADGVAPQPPQVDYAVVHRMVTDEIAKIPVPATAEPLEPLQVEFQSNPLSGNLEWRYIGDDSWQLLIQKCSLIGVCP